MVRQFFYVTFFALINPTTLFNASIVRCTLRNTKITDLCKISTKKRSNERDHHGLYCLNKVIVHDKAMTSRVESNPLTA